MNNCDLSLCHQPVKFAIRRIKTNQWLNVCGSHDNYIGIENLVGLGHTMEEARRINREVKSHKED